MLRRTIAVTRRSEAKRGARHSVAPANVLLRERLGRYSGLTAIGRRAP